MKCHHVENFHYGVISLFFIAKLSWTTTILHHMWNSKLIIATDIQTYTFIIIDIDRWYARTESGTASISIKIDKTIVAQGHKNVTET